MEGHTYQKKFKGLDSNHLSAGAGAAAAAKPVVGSSGLQGSTQPPSPQRKLAPSTIPAGRGALSEIT